jgi:hypothetical protein
MAISWIMNVWKLNTINVAVLIVKLTSVVRLHSRHKKRAA